MAPVTHNCFMVIAIPMVVIYSMNFLITLYGMIKSIQYVFILSSVYARMYMYAIVPVLYIKFLIRFFYIKLS